jgi:hypothetical protein
MAQPMTAEDMLARESIRQVMARYTTAGDRLRDEEFVAVFTEDAIIEAEGLNEADKFRYEGREAIREWIARWRDRPEGAPPTHQASFVRHHLSTCDIETLAPDSAKARTYWVAWTDVGPDHAGYYLDDFRRVDGHWLIAWRRIREDWRSPDSLFDGAVANSR